MKPAIVVMAKAPAPGRSKTRLCPPLSADQAAAVAAACLEDTLRACAGVSARLILALDGPPDGWIRPGVRVVGQRGTGLGERLAAAASEAGGPVLLIGADTPQLTPRPLGDALTTLCAPGVEAVLGPAADGGYWAIGLRSADPRVFAGIPMSTAVTGTAQRRRLHALGLRTVELPVLRDVDTIADARAVAHEAPWTLFAATLRTLARAAG